MTEEQILLVQQSFKKVLPISDIAAELFYRRLFEVDPTLQLLFRGDMKEQGKKLMNMLTIVVKGLGNIETLLPAVKHLGRSHSGYDVTDEHYATVGEALIWTLREGLGDAFTPEVESAWLTAYGLLSTVMKDAAATAEKAIVG